MTENLKKYSISTICLYLFAVSTLVSQTAMDLFASLFFLSAIWQICRNSEYRKHVLRPNGFEKIVGIWFLVTALGIFLGQHLVSNVMWVKLLDFRWLLLAVLIGRHISWVRPTQNQMISLLAWYAFGSLFAILVFVLGYDPLSPGHVMDTVGDGTVRTGGFHRQPIVFAQLYALWFMLPAAYIVMDLPLFGRLRKVNSESVTVWTAFILGAIALLLSFTRGVWLSIPIALLVMVMMRRWWWGLTLFVGGGLSVSLLAWQWPALRERIFQAFSGGDIERLWIWKTNWQMFLDHPIFGVGYNHNVELLSVYYVLVSAPANLLHSHAHCQFLHILTGTGLTGLLFYLAFWALFLLRAIRGFIVSKEFMIRSMYLGLVGVVMVFLAGGLFESNFEHSKIRYTLALMLGLLVALDDGLKRKS